MEKSFYICTPIQTKVTLAQVAELVDALVSNTSS